jgi:hypothetical protein
MVHRRDNMGRERRSRRSSLAVTWWRGSGVGLVMSKGGGGNLSSSVVSLERGGGELGPKMEVVEDCKDAFYRLMEEGELVW